MRTILYICKTKDVRMKQRITLSLSESSINFAKKYAKKSNSSVSEMFDNYFGTLKKIEETNKKLKVKDPFIEKFAGVFDTGSKDILKEVFK